jgi:hypothetical protein
VKVRQFLALTASLVDILPVGISSRSDGTWSSLTIINHGTSTLNATGTQSLLRARELRTQGRKRPSENSV